MILVGPTVTDAHGDASTHHGHAPARVLPHVDEQHLIASLERGGLLTQRVRQALVVARLAHHQQQRFDGSPYLEQHVFPIAERVGHHEPEKPETAVMVALLHDVLEDCRAIDQHDLTALFGPEIATAVDTLTKPWARQDRANDATPEERELREQAYFERIKRAPRFVQRVKVFDRLNNLACIHQRPRSKQLEYAAESRDFHLPLARSLDPELAAEMEALLRSLG
jgi:(p)ppGpp synthase/HD superfamily hydrolase